MQQHYLFSYGTLQLERVQIETYGRKLIGKPDRLKQYKLDQLQITDPDVLAKHRPLIDLTFISKITENTVLKQHRRVQKLLTHTINPMFCVCVKS